MYTNRYHSIIFTYIIILYYLVYQKSIVEEFYRLKMEILI